MKGIYLIAIATVFLATWCNVIDAEKEEFDEIPTECPAKDPENGTAIHIAHESDCTKFYECNAGKKILRQCPEYNDKGDRLWFNPRIQICDWPWNVDCKHNKSGEDQAIATNKEIRPNLEDEEDESWEEFSEIPTECPAKDPMNTTIHLAHEYDCTKFYMCQAGRKILMQCPYMNEQGDRLYFNPRLQVCDLPWNVDCKHNKSGEDQAIATSKEIRPILEDEEDESWEGFSEIPTECPAKDPMNTTIHLAHEYDCTKFYMCQAGRKILMQCPYMNKQGDRLHFNPRLQVCDWPDHAGCQTRGSTQHTDRPTDPTWPTRHTDHTRPTDSTWHTHHTDDTRPTETTWSTEHTDHTRPTDSTWHTHHTDDIRTTEPIWTTQRPPNDECPLGSDGRLLPHQCNCSLCYECVNGDRVLRECSNGMYFSKKYQSCVKFEDSDCDRKPLPKCTREGDLVPHECDCTKYYECRKDDQVLRKCKDGRHFSPERRRCEDPDKAGCEDRESSPDPRPGDCPRPVPENPWRHECDCRLFYTCENGKKRLYECPWGYYFDVKKDRCVREEYITDCKHRWDD